MLSRLNLLLTPFAEGLGGLGLFVLAFFDSSFIPLPTATDGALLVMVAQHPSRWAYYAVASTVGSMAGCYVLYALARKGGEAFLRRKVKEHHIERGMALFRRYGLLAVVVPSLLPPPTPFKIFVLLAGVSNVSPGTFLLALAIGRGFRYGGEALLARRYGAHAGQFIAHHLTQISLWLAVALLIGGAGFALWRRRRAT